MPISNLVECAVNLAEKVTGRDIDGDGDVGVAVRRPLAASHPPPSAALWPECCAVSQPSLSWFVQGNVSAKEQLDDAKEKTNLNAKVRCRSMTVMLPLASHAHHARTHLPCSHQSDP
jgi:hypothetical protein